MTLDEDVVAAFPWIATAFAVSALITFLLTPLVRRLAQRADAVDRPNHRRVNVAPVARGGGLAIAAGFVAAACVVAIPAIAGDDIPLPAALTGGNLAILLGGAGLAAAIGTLDDVYDLRARWQLLGQIVVGAVVLIANISVGGIDNPFGSGRIQLDGAYGIYGAAFTVVWVVGIINSINFIDGLDGLSSGIGVIAAVTLGVLSLTASVAQPFVAVLCFALAGSLIGFLRWNFHPASIFAGTSGVMFVGYALAVLSILGTAKVAVALLVLGIPIIDTFWIIVRRLAAGRSPFTPDRGHIHHRLLDLGLSHRQTVLLIYAICAGLGALSLILSAAGQFYAFLGVLVGFGLLLFALTRGRFAAAALEPHSYESAEFEEAADEDDA
jgi:UDP-GlcNAc:undecaprenyl-phosphate GlcNAc-1-phosphate transferase